MLQRLRAAVFQLHAHEHGEGARSAGRKHRRRETVIHEHREGMGTLRLPTYPGGACRAKYLDDKKVASISLEEQESVRLFREGGCNTYLRQEPKSKDDRQLASAFGLS